MVGLLFCRIFVPLNHSLTKTFWIMKRAILILSFVFASLAVQSVMAQNTIVVSEDTLVIPYYDTVVVFHHPDFVSCNKTVWNYRIPDNHFADGTMEDYYSMLIQATKSSVTIFCPLFNDSVTFGPRDLAGSFFGKNSYDVEAYGQPFHFDSLVTIIRNCSSSKRSYLRR